MVLGSYHVLLCRLIQDLVDVLAVKPLHVSRTESLVLNVGIPKLHSLTIARLCYKSEGRVEIGLIKLGHRCVGAQKVEHMHIYKPTCFDGCSCDALHASLNLLREQR